MLKIFTLLCFTTPILCQDGMAPDVTFGDQNDRFDINDMLQHSKSYFNDEPNYERSKIDNSMRADDTILDAIPERRQNYANYYEIDSINDESRAFYEALKAYEQNNKKTRRNSPIISSSLGTNGDTLQKSIPRRRQNYAYHDKMDPDKDEARADYETNLKAYALNNKKTRRNKPIITNSVRQNDDTLQKVIPERQQNYAHQDNTNPDKDESFAGNEANLTAYPTKVNQTRRNIPRILSWLNHDTLQKSIPERRQNYADRNLIFLGREKEKKKISFQSIIDDLHAGKIYGSRRDGADPLLDPDLKIMMQYAVPINAKFHGFLTAPLAD